MLLELSITLLENIYSTGITHDDHLMMIFIMMVICLTHFMVLHSKGKLIVYGDCKTSKWA